MIEPDLLYSVLCDEVRREDNGKLMLLGLFEQVAASQFPVQHPVCCIVNKWCNGAGAWRQETRFVDEDDHIICQEAPIHFNLESMDAHFTSVQVFCGVTFQKPGRIYIEILLNGELKQRYALHILQAQPQSRPA